MRAPLERLAVITPATAQFVELAKIKSHLRIDHGDDDALLEDYAASALSWLQPPTGWLGRSVLRQTLQLSMPCWPNRWHRLPAGPVHSIVTVTYFDAENVERTLSGGLYFLDGDRLTLAAAFSPPSLYDRPGAVRVQYQAGYANADSVPLAVRQAALMLIGHWYENREAVATVGNFDLLPLGVQELLHPFRYWS